MLVALGLYPAFEVAFLERSELHYNGEGALRILSDEVCFSCCSVSVSFVYMWRCVVLYDVV